MNLEVKGLTINNQFFTVPELEKFCREQISGKIRGEWKIDVYRFILDFFGESEFILQETSGSTGNPKTIQLSKQAMLKSAENTISFFKLKKNQNAVLCLPVKYIAGKMMILRAIMAEMNLILIEPAGTPDFSNQPEIDFCAMVPMQAANLLSRNLWPRLKTIILGGSEIRPELVRQLLTLETEVFETFGMAETCSHVALKRLNGKTPQAFFTALPGISIFTDERDCLVIDATYLPDKIITNDRVEMLAENQFKWLGRIDNVINSGGIKIQAEILEQKIENILQQNCAVVGIPDVLLGQKPVLVVESDDELNKEKIIQKLSAEIESKSIPKTIVFLTEIPRNNSFKIDRSKLRKLIFD